MAHSAGWDLAAIPKIFRIATNHAFSSLTFCRSSRKQLHPANPTFCVKTVSFDKETSEEGAARDARQQ